MDTDSEGEDLPEEKFKHYINLASQMIIEFEKAYYGESYSKKDRPKQKPLAITISRSQKLLIKERKKMEALACMRKK